MAQGNNNPSTSTPDLMDSLIPDMVETQSEEVQTDDGQVDDQGTVSDDNQSSDQGSEDEEVSAPDDGQTDISDNVTLTKAEYDELLRTKESYSHLQPKFTKTAQELSALKKQSTAQKNPTQDRETPDIPVQQTQQQTQGQTSRQTNTVQSLIADTVRKAVQEYIAPVQERLNETEMDTKISNKVKSLERANPEDFDTVMPMATAFLKENADLWSLGEEKALDIAYKAAKASILEQTISDAVADGIEKRSHNKEVKTDMQSTRTKASSNQKPTKSETDAMADEIVNAAMEMRKRGSSLLS